MLNKVCEIIDANKVEKVVLGLPRHMNGDEGIRAKYRVTLRRC